MRIIPKHTKVKIEFFKNFSLGDVLLAFSGLLLVCLMLLSNVPAQLKACIIIVIVVLYIFLFVPLDGVKVYKMIVYTFKFLSFRKSYSRDGDIKTNVKNVIPFTGVTDDGFIDYGTYFAGVIEIMPKEFRLLSEYKQNDLIENVIGNIIRAVSGTARCSIVKLDRPIIMEGYAADEKLKEADLKRVAEAGEMEQSELDARLKINTERERVIESLSSDNKIYKSAYYLVVYDGEKTAITEVLTYAKNLMADNAMSSEILDQKQLALFLKYNYTNDFDEKELDNIPPSAYVDWIAPDYVQFKLNKVLVGNEETFNFTIRDYPLTVGNAWGYQLFNIMNTKVVMNLMPIEKQKSIKSIDRAIDELISQSNSTYKASSLVSQETHIQTLIDLLTMLSNGNETLFETTVHITVYKREEKVCSKSFYKENIKKKVARIISENGFKSTDNFGKQFQAFVSSSLSQAEMLTEYQRSIHSNSIAASFPFVLNSVLDDKGIILGDSNYLPVVLDFFKRDNERVNSNVVILGKSGSGKSFATKTILANLAAENCKIFILDPENEYNVLAKNLGGKLIDVGTAKEGRLNPFQIITALDADEAEGEGANSSFYVHLQFLEEFFKQILPGISVDALEFLNNLIIKLYASKGITVKTDLSKLKNEDYPIFDDLYEMISDGLKNAKDDYTRTNYRILDNFISKFSGDGRNANLWNGANTLSVKENFTVFNFQSLLANKNNTVANAQMLLVLKWLDNEIIKNRDFNLKHNTNRKIIVAIDEAHVFIDAKYPIALDFMFQLAKRIRKYNGMQIIITQNIKDFVGSEEIARKSTAIINACQYSFIFALAPNDMQDLCTLYEKAGEINEVEQEEIINNARGSAFVITGPLTRSNMNIIATEVVQNTFEKNNITEDSKNAIIQ